MPGSRNGYFQQHKLEQWEKGEEVKTLEIKKMFFNRIPKNLVDTLYVWRRLFLFI